MRGICRGISWACSAVVAGLLGLPATALAQEAVPAESGGEFGERDSFVLGVERVFGFNSQEISVGDASQTIDSTGLFPAYWGHIGLYSMTSSGLNYGALVGVGHQRFSDDDDDTNTTFVRLGPRIGYAGSLRPGVGYWAKGGPSVIFGMTKDQEQDSTGVSQTVESTAYALAFSAELYAVIIPVPHVGFVFGPHMDINITGSISQDAGGQSQDEDYGYGSLGLTAGIIGEFY